MTRHAKIRAAAGLFLTILAGSTVFFRLVEGWGWVDAYYFSVVTMATVGYGDLAPATDLGKIGATVLIFLGIGTLAVLVQQIAEQGIENRMNRKSGKRQD